MNPRVCNELYLKAIKDETLDKDLFRPLWLWQKRLDSMWSSRMRKARDWYPSFIA
jgi:hypothetical protein